MRRHRHRIESLEKFRVAQSLPVCLTGWHTTKCSKHYIKSHPAKEKQGKSFYPIT